MRTSALIAALKARDLRAVDLARSLNVHKATVSRWAKGRVPAERVLEIEAATGVSRHVLRPDIYPRAEAAA